MRAGADHSLDFVLERPRQDLELARPIASAAFSAEPSAEAPPAEAQGRGAVAAARSGKPRGQGTGIIKANSIPVSEVLVDGRMAGQTPANISAAPGLHTVVFIHPDYGRREVVVQVKPNQDAVAAVRFRRSGP
jgi:serine/threonine-protein kinase